MYLSLKGRFMDRNFKSLKPDEINYLFYFLINI